MLSNKDVIFYSTIILSLIFGIIELAIGVSSIFSLLILWGILVPLIIVKYTNQTFANWLEKDFKWEKK